MNIDLTVNVNTLKTSWESLPEDIKVWSLSLADAMKEQHDADNALKLIAAKLEIAIRTNPTDYGGLKQTESVVAAQVLIQPQYTAAVEALAQAKHSVNVTKAIVEALEAKRSALKYMTEMQIAGFVNSMGVPSGIRGN